jgi:hypothetical protein
VREGGLVGADLLGRHELVEGHGDLGHRPGEEVVVAVGEDGQLPAGVPQRAERRPHVGEDVHRAPAVHEHAVLSRPERDAGPRRGATQRLGEDVGVARFGLLGLDLELGREVGRQQGVGVRPADRRDRAADAAHPVGEGAVAVERGPAVAHARAA